MILLFLFLLFTSFHPTSVHADDFNIGGDSRHNLFRHATTIVIESVEDSINTGVEILYDSGDLSGRFTTDVLENEDPFTLTYANHQRRILGIADEVKGPPGTKVNVLYHYANEAGHPVEVSKVFVPFSSELPENGFWLNITDEISPGPIYQSLSILYDSNWIVKTAFLREYLGPGMIQNEQRGSLILDTLTISNPILVKRVEGKLIPGSGRGEFTVVLENRGNKDLEHILLEHEEYIKEITIPALEQVSVSYTLEDFSNIDKLKIHNPNEEIECAIHGNPQNEWLDVSGVTVVAFREDGGFVHGPVLQSEGGGFCISRSSYTMVCEVVILEDSERFVKEKVKHTTQEDVVEEILGVQEYRVEKGTESILLLPKTGIW